jgi:hypothetical protein
MQRSSVIFVTKILISRAKSRTLSGSGVMDLTGGRHNISRIESSAPTQILGLRGGFKTTYSKFHIVLHEVFCSGWVGSKESHGGMWGFICSHVAHSFLRFSWFCEIQTDRWKDLRDNLSINSLCNKLIWHLFSLYMADSNSHDNTESGMVSSEKKNVISREVIIY